MKKKCIQKLSKQHNNGPLTECVVDGHQFHKIETCKYVLKTSLKDSCVRVHGKVSLIKNIIMSGDAKILIVYQSFQATDSFFFTIPLESKLLGILKVSNLDENLHIARLSDIDAKYVILQVRNANVVVPFSDATW